MILLPKTPRVVNKKENWARLEIEAPYPGYGVTIGNSLRRVLLSSLPGAAVTQMKIKGVQHEYSTIPGVLEDVLVIAMNLKQLRLKMYVEEPQKATLKIKGEKEIKGSDFKFPSQVELVNKSCHIATLTDKKAELNMEIQIERGVGYEPVERRKKQKKLEIGVILIDAIFTPVEKVSSKIEHMRVGERTDFDRLFLDIETDGTITSEEAFFQASKILVKHFSLFEETFRKQAEKEVSQKRTSKKKSVSTAAPASKRKATAAKKSITVKKKQKK